MRHPSVKAPRTSRATRDFIAELTGTFMFVYLGQSAFTSLALTGTQNSETSARLASTITCYGLAYLFAALLTLTISGAHLNPAYTLALACYGHFNWKRVPTFMMAQYSGAFVAACFVHATYNDKIDQRHTEGLLNGMNTTMRAHGSLLSTGKFFTTYPPIDVSLTQMFISHTMATAILSMLLITVLQSRCARMPRFFQPIFMGLALILVMATFAANGGPCVNPAADFSPRLYASISGWGGSAFNLFHYTYWWICGILAPHFGALLGIGVYQIIEILHEDQRRCHIYSASGLDSKSSIRQRKLTPVEPSSSSLRVNPIETTTATASNGTTASHRAPPHYHQPSSGHGSNNMDPFTCQVSCPYSMVDGCCSSPLVNRDDGDDELNIGMMMR